MENVHQPSDTSVSKCNIPTIDLSTIRSITEPTESDLQDLAKQVHDALSTTGLAFFINHGISKERFESVNKLYDSFLALPEDIKNKYEANDPQRRQGYIPPGTECLDKSKREVRHGYNIISFSEEIPTEVPNFKEVIGGVSDDFMNLAILLLRVIATMLELDAEIFLGYHNMMKKDIENSTTFRMLYYPPVGDEELDSITRCGAHCDWGTFTLLTENGEGGLEVFVGEQWVPVGILPGAILLNLGDMMEVWTSSRYKAIEHRVVVPDDPKLRAKGRHSFALFIHPDDTTPADPLFLQHCRTGEPMKETNCLNSIQYIENKIIGTRPY